MRAALSGRLRMGRASIAPMRRALGLVCLLALAGAPCWSGRARAQDAEPADEAIAGVEGEESPELRALPEARMLAQEADHKVYNIVHLIYRAKSYESVSKDYEFSRRTMEEHWQVGYNDMVRTLRHPEVLERPRTADGVFTFDLAAHGREQEHKER